MPQTATPEALCCSFCTKSQFDVVKLVAGPGVFICNECIDLCTQILAMHEVIMATMAQGLREEDVTVLTKLQRTFIQQVELLARLQGKTSQQRIVIERVDVSAGGR